MYINSQTLKTYATHSEVRADFPAISLPVFLTDASLEDIGVYPVEGILPTYNPITQSATELPPALVGGKWVQQWEIVELFSTQAEKDAAIAADIEAKRKASVPASVTRRQAKQALLLNGLLANVQPAIDAIPDAAQRAMIQIEWDDSQVFERDRPALIALGSALGLSSTELDNLFIGAAQL